MSSDQIPRTMKAVFITEHGDPLDVVKYGDIEVPTITDDQILVKNKYGGINFYDSYVRKGIFDFGVPCTLGVEGAGEIVALGKNVEEYAVGDIVAYSQMGAFAEYTKIEKTNVMIFKIPEGTAEEKIKIYAGIFSQGLTALSFVNEAYKVQKEQFALVHAAAGGVGLFLTQLLRNEGARVIATASSAEKLEVARKAGAEFLINYRTDSISEKVSEFTHGKGVDVLYDGVGKAVFEESLKSMALKGTFINYGDASGPCPPLNLAALTPQNIKIMRPSLFNYVRTTEKWDYYTKWLLQLVEAGEIETEITATFPLSEYKKAAQTLEGRTSTGKVMLSIP
ncbi:CYFA0S17e00914g1_1 [Cyberlindnera fabianii]|uniref:Probable quinone oxidoreductase n=1 Tax=Cyberlindnera fabianii TaxID=36022 RepID=A0A061BBM3_CYBFA|nr:CYFA0S17e00914g1_1 [Cyberlindnera fabianii]